MKDYQKGIWFEGLDEEIQEPLKDKKFDKNALRDRIGTLENRWLQKKAEETEQFAKEKNNREFYATLNEVDGPRSRNSHSVRSKMVFTSSEEIKNGWVEHFSELLNQPSEVDMTVLEEIE